MTPPPPPPLNHQIHIGLSILTAGFWLPVYALLLIRQGALERDYRWALLAPPPPPPAPPVIRYVVPQPPLIRPLPPGPEVDLGGMVARYKNHNG